MKRSEFTNCVVLTKIEMKQSSTGAPWVQFKVLCADAGTGSFTVNAFDDMANSIVKMAENSKEAVLYVNLWTVDKQKITEINLPNGRKDKRNLIFYTVERCEYIKKPEGIGYEQNRVCSPIGTEAQND